MVHEKLLEFYSIPQLRSRREVERTPRSVPPGPGGQATRALTKLWNALMLRSELASHDSACLFTHRTFGGVGEATRRSGGVGAVCQTRDFEDHSSLGNTGGTS